MGFIDLHVHSAASDGSLRPAELVEYACSKGLTAIAITDHDTVDGLPSAMRMAMKRPIRVIPGVELTARFGAQEIHILGYNVNYENVGFVRTLHRLSALREERNEKICSLLRTYGVDVTLEELKNRNISRILTRTHIANFLLEEGYVLSKAEAFEKYLGIGRPCYIPSEKLTAFEAANIIKAAGGFASLAHPVKYKLNDDEMFKMLATLKDIGIHGIEAIYSTHTYDDESRFMRLAEMVGLYITGGSDFHGRDIKPDIEIGTGCGNLMIPQQMLDYLGF